METGRELSREEAITKVGLAAVEAVEAEDCEPTSSPYWADRGLMEWAATIDVDDAIALRVYYYTNDDDQQQVIDSGGDWGVIHWEPDHYELV